MATGITIHPAPASPRRPWAASDGEFEGGATSLFFLFAANLMPLLGVLFQEWELITVVLLYWLETAIIGFYFILKMVVHIGWQARTTGDKRLVGAGFFLVPFFLVHLGGFMLGHLFFIIFLLGGKDGRMLTRISDPGSLLDSSNIPGLLSFFSLAVLSLLISHGYSFFANYLGRGEFKQTNLGRLSLAPYGRVVAMHLTIMGGTLFILLLGPAPVMLAILVGLKTMIDLRSHRREHVRYKTLEPRRPGGEETADGPGGECGKAGEN